MSDAADARAIRDTTLFRIGAWAALATAVIIPIQIVGFIANPLPTTVDGWLALLSENRLGGLIDLDILLVLDYLLLIAILVALFVALDGQRSALVLLATVFGIAGVVLYLASNPALAMLSISDQYGAATTDAARAGGHAAAQATLASFTGTAFNVSYLIGSLVLIALSVPMIRSPRFGRAVGSLGIVSNVVALGLYVPVVGLGLAVLSVFGVEGWYILVGWHLLRAAAGPTGGPGGPAASA